MQRRSGFSLLEVSIALLLGAFLMLAVFQSFFVAARYRLMAGENHTRGLSLSNALRDLSSDLNAVRVQLSPTNQVDQGMNSGSRAGGRDGRRRAMGEAKLRGIMAPKQMVFRDSFVMDSLVEWTTFNGKQDYVAFRSRAWNSRFTLAPNDVSGAGDSLVIWWLYRGSAPRVEGWLKKELPITRTLKVPPAARGLIRTQFFVDATGKESETSQVILPEATSLRLRYFNGSELLDNWDWTTEGALPTAIEVEFSLENATGAIPGNAVNNHWLQIPTANMPSNYSQVP